MWQTRSKTIRTVSATIGATALAIAPLSALAAQTRLSAETAGARTLSPRIQGPRITDRLHTHVRNGAKCPDGQWIGFTHGNTDINAFYDGNTGSGPNGCEVSDNALTVPNASAQVPAKVTLPVGTTAQVNASITVASAGTLTVPGGDTLQMQSNYSIYVQSGGTLNLSGTDRTASGLVTVDSPTDQPGNWAMIDYQKGSAGAVSYTLFDDGGAGDTDGNGDGVYTELAIEGVNISVTNSQFVNSYGNGIQVMQGGKPKLTDDKFAYSTTSGFGASTSYAVQYDVVPGDLSKTVSGLTSTGYGYNDVQIGTDGGDVGTYSGTGTWPNVGIPYRLGVSVDLASRSSLTIPAGVTLLMTGSSLFAEAGSTLVLAGTTKSPVTITSASDFKGSTQADNPGDWGGIDFQDNSAGSITDAVIKDGGSSIGASAGSVYAEVVIEGVRSLVSVTGTKVQNSYGNGIELTDHAKASLTDDTFSYCTACSFSDSSGYAVHYDFLPATLVSGSGASATPLLAGLTSNGYGLNTVYLAGSTTSTGNYTGNGVWPDPGMPYSLDGDLFVTAGQSLTIGEGVTIRMSGGLYADNNGHLTIAGTATAPITLTSVNDFPLSSQAPAPGDWSGIDYENGSTGSISYVVVKYSGEGTADGSADLVIAKVKAGFTVTDCKFLSSNNNDVEVVNGGQPHLNRDQLGTVASGSYGVFNNNGSGPKIDASRDYWGSSKGPKGTKAPASAGVNTSPWYSNTSVASTAHSTKPAVASVLKAFSAKGSIGASASGGTGGVGVDTFTSNPTSSTPASNAVTYFDARTDAQNTFKKVVVDDCDSTKGETLVFYNGSGWQVLAKVTGPNSKGCLSATITNSSKPSLSALTGNGVAFAAVLPAVVTNTALTSSATKNATTYGAKVTLTAKVTAATGKPKGSVAFEMGSTVLGTKALSSGKAVLTTTSLSPGKHALKAVYTPASGSGFSGSTSSVLKLTVKPAPVVLTYTGPTSIATGKSVQLSATLKSTGKAAISGRVLKLSLGTGSSAETCSTVKTNKKGSASCTIKKVTLKKGKSTMTMTFAGDPSGAADFYEAGVATKNVTID